MSRHLLEVLLIPLYYVCYMWVPSMLRPCAFAYRLCDFEQHQGRCLQVLSHGRVNALSLPHASQGFCELRRDGPMTGGCQFCPRSTGNALVM